MRYDSVVPAIFLSRPNRFVARVLLDGREETVHVKNTGRLRELLIPGTQAVLARADNPARRTAYDLVTALTSTSIPRRPTPRRGSCCAGSIPGAPCSPNDAMATPASTSIWRRGMSGGTWRSRA